MLYEGVQCRREVDKRAAWEVLPQGRNLKELAGEHHKGWSLRFNWIQRRETYRERRQNDSQADDFA